jgi:hypothetical protein
MTDDVVVSKVKATSKTWRDEALRRRGISKSDPVADALDYCAGEITTVLQLVASETQHLTVDQFARKAGVTAQTVRTWIRDGRTPATLGARGYEISRDTPIPRRTLRRKVS